MSVALKAVALALRFTQTVKRLAGFQGNRESRLAGTLEAGAFFEFSRIGDYYVTYNLWNFRIDSITIETSTNFFIQQKFLSFHGNPRL